MENAHTTDILLYQFIWSQEKQTIMIVTLVYVNFVFLGFLKGKTCVLVTHQVQYLTSVDKIVVMENVNCINYKLDGVCALSQLWQSFGLEFVMMDISCHLDWC